MHKNSYRSNGGAAVDNDGPELITEFARVLLKRKYFILLTTIACSLSSIIYMELTAPIYRATAMIQVEDESPSGMPDFGNFMAGSIFGEAANAITEIELLKSRSVIGDAVDRLKLDVVVKPKLFPVIGNYCFRSFACSGEPGVADPKFGAKRYAWGGESIDVFRFEVPRYAIGKPFTIQAGENGRFALISDDGEILLEGAVGEDLSMDDYKVSIRSLQARAGTEFSIVKRDRLDTIESLQDTILAIPKRDADIIDLSIETEDPDYAITLLDEVMETYVRYNVERNSAEAQQSLDFLEEQLPKVKKQLEEAEAKFNEYQIDQESVDISLETQGILERIVELETKLQELELRRLEMSRLFKQEHPLYQGIIKQIELVEEQKDELTEQVTDLPETQQELLRFARDVQVGSELYIMLLSKSQELDIVRAGTVGDVRIVDSTAVNMAKPISPNRNIILFGGIILGLASSISLVLFEKYLAKGLGDPDEVEALGLPVYATIPFSKKEVNVGARKTQKVRGADQLLAVRDPADLAMEALRSLRTSLHFALLETDNNVIAISGPAPNVGKTFVSSNLAAVIALSGKRVLLVDADLRNGNLRKYFGVNPGGGFSDYLSGAHTVEEVIHASKVDGLSFISRGTVPPNASELLMHSRFDEFIKYANKNYDLVIIDSPPVLAVTDAAIVGRHAGCMLLVVRYGQTHAKELEICLRRLGQNGVQVKGSIFNGIPRDEGATHGYYHYEYKSTESD